MSDIDFLGMAKSGFAIKDLNELRPLHFEGLEVKRHEAKIVTDRTLTLTTQSSLPP